MKTLVYVPIIHTSADLGSLAKDVAKRGIANLGEELWKSHRETVNGFWDAISHYFESMDVASAKIYQDGMVAEGEVGERIVGEGVKQGSKNYELVSKLIRRGAILVKTEDFNLVKEELDRLRRITQPKNLKEKVFSFIKYKLTKNSILNKRDKFIAKRINETLHHSEKGILFIGAYHNIKQRLSRDIHIKEIKDMEKVRNYQRLLPFYKNKRKQFEGLGRYLISNIAKG